MNIVLLEPEIPFNAGNIGRTCVLTNSILHLIGPLGFFLDDKYVKRAGLDYWKDLKLYYYDNYEEFIKKNNVSKIYMATTKSKKNYTDFEYNPGDYFMFGKESAGIPKHILEANIENCIKVPIFEKYRSLNLSTSVAIVLYEALRQNNFYNLK